MSKQHQKFVITPDLLKEPGVQKRPAPMRVVAPGNQQETDAEAAVNELLSKGIDITSGTYGRSDYEQWLHIGFSLSSLGEFGRDLFHKVSSLYSGYNYQECDDQFTKCLKRHNGSKNIESFFYECKQAGIDLNFKSNQVPSLPPAPWDKVEPVKLGSEIVEDPVKKLKAFKFNSSAPIEKPIAVIGIDDHILATKGNLFTIAGQAKAGKSGFVSATLAGVMALPGDIIDTLGLSIATNTEGKAVVHIDSEQSRYDHHRGMLAVLRRASRKQEPDWFHSYNFQLIEIKDRAKALKELCAALATHYNGIHLIVLDGGADFVLDTNDLKESNEVVQFFSSLAIDYDCPLLVVLHFNPGSEKGRGHFGSQLERKSETVISVSKDKDSEVSTIEGKFLRNSGNIPNLQFIYDTEKGYHVYNGVKTKQNPKDAKSNKIQSLVEEIFEPGASPLTYTELCSQIELSTGKTDRTAKTYIKEMIQTGQITKDPEGKLIRSNPDNGKEVKGEN